MADPEVAAVSLSLSTPSAVLPFAADEPAGGAALGEVAIATASATLVTVALLWLCAGHRSGRVQVLGRIGAFAERALGLPAWAAVPSALAAPSLLTALLGMYWDIALHIDQGRDAGPLANPAHYLILFGLFGIFAAGVLAVAMPKPGERPGPAPLRISGDWYAPVGGVLMAACGAFALAGFPLDDLWHRLFGQDVTLWGPTHLMLIGGAGMSLIGQAVLLREAMHARRTEGTDPSVRRRGELATVLRRVGIAGGLLIGLSTFQGEFDFGVPQFRLVFHPLLIAWAAAFGLVAARLWIGPGGAIGAALFFLVVRGAVGLIVGPVFGEVTPAMALYVPEAILIELAAVWLARRPLALGVAGGVLAGTVGLAAEWGWSHLVMRLPWTAGILPEAVVLSVTAGVAGGLMGALLAAGLTGRLPRPGVARPAAALALVLLAVVVADGLITTAPPADARAAVTLDDGGRATVRISPAPGEHAGWVTVTAWQGGDILHVDRLQRVAEGVYRSREPVPVDGTWKALVRVHEGRTLAGIPIRLPEDTAIPAAEVPVSAEPRALVRDHRILQRERKQGVPAWLSTVGPLVVLILALTFAGALAWGVGRVGSRQARAHHDRPGPPAAEAAHPPAPTPVAH